METPRRKRKNFNKIELLPKMRGLLGNIGVVSQISQQVMTFPAPGERYTRGFLTGRPRAFSLFIAHTYTMASPTWPL
ncbi:hypothetical protein C0073_016370 [Aeromonas veronii]|nr:hypothetical protein C0073_016370 [Aeromonas veronii]